jgi:hypothetical protein
MQVFADLGEGHVRSQPAGVFLNDLADPPIETDDGIGSVGSFGPASALPVPPPQVHNANGGHELP